MHELLLSTLALALTPALGPAVELAPAAAPQDAQEAPTFSQEQLEQLVAPIALYPDSLLSQVLMAATYPLDVVDAARWVRDHPGTVRNSLEPALEGQAWDPSVKSLCGVPDVLSSMSANLTWTQDLGDAFLDQQKDLMDAVQRMRRLAYEAGTLESGAHQVVTESDDVLVVESEDPEVIYVPTYSAAAVYGSWGYPHWYYPTLYATPPGRAARVGYAAGATWGAAAWGTCDWAQGAVYVDVDRYDRYVDRTVLDPREARIGVRTGERAEWRHDPERRRGVAYRDPEVARRYGASSGSARGHDARTARREDHATQRHDARTSGSTARQETREEGHDARASGASGRQEARTERIDARSTSGLQSGGYGGARDPELDHASSRRGASSRASAGRLHGRVR